MKKGKKRLQRNLSYLKKSNLGLINRTIRILSWLLPGLVIKRWMITSAIGLVTSLLGIAIWSNLRPLYWLIDVFFWIMNRLTSVLPIAILGPLILLFGLLLIGIGLLSMAVIAIVVFIERGQRRITVNYAQRQQGRRLMQAQASH